MSATPNGRWRPLRWLRDTRRVPVWALAAMLMITWVAFWEGVDRVFAWAVVGGDPETVVVGNGANAREIDPKAEIRRQCAETVLSVRSLDVSGDSWITYHGSEYQSWRVIPTPGHVDRALLNGDTGEVVCP